MSAPTIITLAALALELVVVFGFVLLERRQPVATLAWIMAVIFVPVIGVILYLLFGLRRKVKKSRAAEKVARRTAEVYERHAVHRRPDDAADLPPRVEPLLNLGQRLGRAPGSTGNAATILQDAEATYDAIIDAVAAARDHVHVQFYIIQPDEAGAVLRDLLVAKASEGLEVRVLCDAIGSLSLPTDFWRPLVDAGGAFAFYGPVRFTPRLRHRDHINFRNHRKIVVVDGETGFTGGINVGREYLGLDPKIGHWRDTHMRLDGPAVVRLQQTFVEDWLTTTGELLEDARYFRRFAQQTPGDAVVQVVPSGPDRQWSLIHRIYCRAIAEARDRVWITSPYFVPDRVMQATLETAALAGLDVRLLVPQRSDARLVDWASRSYYGELLDAGVRIFVYDNGFMHAKTMVIDDWLGTIGSANMDIRSFHLNYELNAFVYDRAFVEQLAEQFCADLEHAHELPPDWADKLSYGKRVGHAFAGLLSPLL